MDGWKPRRPKAGYPRDLVVGIVRRPDPVPCCTCAAGEWDMCRNGRYTERGIKERHGYGAEHFRIEPEFAIKLDPALGLLGVLLEPASILAKAWDHVERIGGRSKAWQPHILLVTGAGPIGLLAALMGAQRGLEVHVFDRDWTGPKPESLRALGGIRCASLDDALEHSKPDIVMECTSAAPVIGICSAERRRAASSACWASRRSATRSMSTWATSIGRGA